MASITFPMPDFSSYLESVRRHYEQWWSLYTLTDAEGRSQVKAKGEVFDFGLMVQTIAPKSERMDGDRSEAKETIERFTVLDGLRKYAGEHVLLVGRPGSGKSTALARLLLEEAEKTNRIPVLVELRYWNEDGVLGLIRSFLRSLPTQVGLTPMEVDRTTLEELLRSNRFLLLMDGLNELPSEAARQDVLRFRREFAKVAIVFTTRDLSLGGDFGIEKKLEMQPLTEAQMRSFVTAYLPEPSEAMLRQLGGRLREFGSTPLLLWMLCGLFRQTGEIPANLGEVFRVFTQGYEQRLKADVVAEIDRRWWAGLLQELAARMMIGDGSVEFRVAIDRAEVEAIFTEFLRDREALAAGAARKGLEDLLRHHLIQTNGLQVEFRHQLMQEYYAAEWLLGQVGGLDDATVQQEFLNYLKWTEPVALMLALVEDEALAVRVVELALDVDLMLGARVAGEVRSDFQKQTVAIVSNLKIPKQWELGLIKFKRKIKLPEWLRLELLERTRSAAAIPGLLQALKDPKSEWVRRWAVVHLGQLGLEAVIPILIQALQDSDSDSGLHRNAIAALGKLRAEIAVPDLLQELVEGWNLQEHVMEALGLIGSESVISGLLQALKDDDRTVRLNAASALGKIGLQIALPGIRQGMLFFPDLDRALYRSIGIRGEIMTLWKKLGLEAVILGLRQVLQDPDSGVRGESAVALGKLGSEVVILDLLQMLHDTDSWTRARAADALGYLGSEISIPDLLQSLQDFDPGVRASVATALGSINSEIAIPDLLQVLQDPDSGVRAKAVEAIGNLGSAIAIPDLLQALQDSDSSVSRKAEYALSNLDSTLVIPDLLQVLKYGNSQARIHAAKVLGKLGVESAISDLIPMLQDNDSTVKECVAVILGEMGSESAIPELLRMLQETNDYRQLDAMESLGKLNAEASISGLLQALKHVDGGVRWFAVIVLGKLGAESTIPDLLHVLQDSDVDVRGRAAAILGQMGLEVVIPDLLYALEHAGENVCKHVALALGELSSTAAIPGLLHVLRHGVGYQSSIAAEALGYYRNDRAAHILPDLLNLLPQKSDYKDFPLKSSREAFKAIQSIQANCKFYNYEIFHSQPAKPQPSQQSPPATTINQYPNATEVKIFEKVDNYHASPPTDPPS